MQIECIDNIGFEDLLTEGQIYRVSELRGNSLRLEDNSGQVRWYGRFKFADPGCFNCTPSLAA